MPLPFTKDQLKAFMDKLFTDAENRVGSLPFGLGNAAKAAIIAVQSAADNDFDAIYDRLQQVTVLSVDAFFDALTAAFASNTVAVAIIAVVKALVDAELVQQQLNQLAAG
jgi:hypothetical protein